MPPAVAMALHGLFNCVDLIDVARVGAGAVAAVTAAGIANMVPMILFSGLADMIAASVAHFTGKKSTSRADRVARDGFTVTAGASILLGVVFVIGAAPLIDAVGLGGEARSTAIDYLVIVSSGSGTMFLLLWATAVMRGRQEGPGRPSSPVGSEALSPPPS